jgi:hypothetical protein
MLACLYRRRAQIANQLLLFALMARRTFEASRLCKSLDRADPGDLGA